MLLLEMKSFDNREVAYKMPRTGDELELTCAAEEYLGEHGGKALGDIDTPAFIRKVSNVTLMPPKEFLLRKIVHEPEEKIADLIAVLRG
jgi:hypothetical protein